MLRPFYFFLFFPMATTSPTAQRPATEDATSPAKPAAEKPLATFRSGSVSAAVYGKKRTLKSGKSATFADVSVRRSYRTDDGGWGHTHTLGGRDLLDAAFVLTRAAAYIAEADLGNEDE
jgi:hypothetical protein